MSQNNNGTFVLLATVAKVDTCKHGGPYATLAQEEPTSFTYTLFPKKGQRKAATMLKKMVLGPVQITGFHIGNEGKIYVYNSTVISQAE